MSSCPASPGERPRLGGLWSGWTFGAGSALGFLGVDPEPGVSVLLLRALGDISGGSGLLAPGPGHWWQDWDAHLRGQLWPGSPELPQEGEDRTQPSTDQPSSPLTVEWDIEGHPRLWGCPWSLGLPGQQPGSISDLRPGAGSPKALGSSSYSLSHSGSSHYTHCDSGLLRIPSLGPGLGPSEVGSGLPGAASCWAGLDQQGWALGGHGQVL